MNRSFGGTTMDDSEKKGIDWEEVGGKIHDKVKKTVEDPKLQEGLKNAGDKVGGFVKKTVEDPKLKEGIHTAEDKVGTFVKDNGNLPEKAIEHTRAFLKGIGVHLPE